ITNHSPQAAARRARMARLYGDRKARGLCRSCGEPVAPGSATWCEKHRRVHNAIAARSNTRRVARRRAAGVCAFCGSPLSEKNRNYCEEHRRSSAARQREASASRIAERRAAGVCWTCGGPPSALNKSYCEEHRLYQRRHEKMRRAKADPLYMPMEMRRRGAARRKAKEDRRRAEKAALRGRVLDLWRTRPDLTAAAIAEAVGTTPPRVRHMMAYWGDETRRVPGRKRRPPSGPGGQYLLPFPPPDQEIRVSLIP